MGSDSKSEQPAPPHKPSSFTSRTLRTWAGIAGIHGIVIAITVSILVPWKTAWVNAMFLFYAGLQGTAAIGLWRRTVWGWRLGLFSGLIGLVSGILVVSGMLLSWVYLRTVYGTFGYGAAIVTLLLAAVAFQVLGLVPAMQLRALLRREIRQDFSSAKAVQSIIVFMLLTPLATAGLLSVRYRLKPIEAVPAAARTQSIAVLHAALNRTGRPPAPALEDVPLGPGPLYVSLWDRGKLVARVRGHGADLAAAVEAAAAALRVHPTVKDHNRTTARLKVDRVSAIGPVLSEWPPLVALSVVPGQDGLRRRDKTTEKVLLPDDMIRSSRFGLAAILPGLHEVRLGLDAPWALSRLSGPQGPLERLRFESWVAYKRNALPVVRGNTPMAPAKSEDLRTAAMQAGAFILRQQRPDGAFHYLYYALDHRHIATSRASLARHAGVIYSLSQLYGRTRDGRFARGAARAARWLLTRYGQSCGAERHCIVRGGRAKLGQTALTLIALLEYQRRTGDDAFSTVTRELADFVLTMQRPDGEFHHVYRVRGQKPNPKPRMMFASEQAALALVMAHEAFGDTRYLKGAERALNFLTGPKYAYFVGWFSYGADHWTCIAAEEAWPRLTSRRYLDFCRGYAAFIRRMQFGPTDAAFSGHYGFSYLLVPQAPATAGFTEALISTYRLSVHHGLPDNVLKAQTLAALEALRRDQLRAANSYLATSPQNACGGMRRSLVQQEIRIDFTQHALSALIRGVDL